MRPKLILMGLALLPSAVQAATRTFTITSFDRIRVEGPFEVVVRTGSGSSARAEAPDQRALERVRIDTLGRTLVIRADQDRNGAPLRGIRILATTPMLSGAALIGAGALTVDTARSARVDLSVSGTGQVRVGAIDADNVSITATGTGRATLAGRTHQLRAIIQGAGQIDGTALSAEDLFLTSAGAGNASLAASRTARIDATGSGMIAIVGHPACTVRAEGSVEVECRSATPR